MQTELLYPLHFQPIFKTAIWGGDRLRSLLGGPPTSEPTGEAWLLSDQGDNRTTIDNGIHAGKTLGDLMADHPEAILGYQPQPGERFPLLLKIIDARTPLSVQVHPNDAQAKQIAAEQGRTTTDLGKTEAWVVVDAAGDSAIYAGLKPGTTEQSLRDALRTNRVAEMIHSFAPSKGDCVFLEAGTVHAIGSGLMIFEVQQTSDITYRFYDWGRVDAKTGQPRQLHISESLRCTNFSRGPVNAVRPHLERNGSYRCESLVKCDYFSLFRWYSRVPFSVGKRGQCRIVVCLDGHATLKWKDQAIAMKLGSAVLLPAAIGEAEIIPVGATTFLEIGVPVPVGNAQSAERPPSLTGG